jgi:hypothetical protein
MTSYWLGVPPSEAGLEPVFPRMLDPGCSDLRMRLGRGKMYRSVKESLRDAKEKPSMGADSVRPGAALRRRCGLGRSAKP